MCSSARRQRKARTTASANTVITVIATASIPVLADWSVSSLSVACAVAVLSVDIEGLSLTSDFKGNDDL